MTDEEAETPKIVPGLDPLEIRAIDSVPPSDEAVHEAALFNEGKSQGEIERLARENEHRRSESFKDHFEHVAICGLWITAFVAVAVGATWLWHLLMPDYWHWLSPDGIQKLQNIVTGGIIASLAVGHVKKRLGT